MSHRLHPPVGVHDHLLGPPDARVKIVMFGDFECGPSGSAAKLLRQLRGIAHCRFQVVFRHFPVPRFHPCAQHAAEMAEIAAERGRFWPMHDLLFEHQDALWDPDLIGYAARLGMDPDWVRASLRLHTCSDRVREHFLSGVRSGVTVTPTFFINDERYEGSFALTPLLLTLQFAARQRRQHPTIGRQWRRGRDRRQPLTGSLEAGDIDPPPPPSSNG